MTEKENDQSFKRETVIGNFKVEIYSGKPFNERQINILNEIGTRFFKLESLNEESKNILYYLVIPSNKKVILNTLKINISMCLIGVITGEFLTSKSGIGYLILYGSQVFNLNLVMSGIVILMVISIIMYKLVTFISK